MGFRILGLILVLGICLGLGLFSLGFGNWVEGVGFRLGLVCFGRV